MLLPPLTPPGDTPISEPAPTLPTGPIHCSLGIDIGSTSTNLVLLDRDNHVIDTQYLRTAGNPKRAV